MVYRLVITSKALDDLDAIVTYIAADNAKAAITFAKAVRSAFKTLKKFPRRCPLAPENGYKGLEIRNLHYGNYRICFTLQHGTVHILSIRHAARDLLA